ncbi:ISAzo13 family transposase [Candidatus Brocadia pituitae]|nr:ISAzo13 family transposase [Candidatus Brocadia pituitae]
MTTEAGLKEKLLYVWPYLNERSRRVLAAAEAKQLGRGGVSLVSRACGLSRVTITKGIRELANEDESPSVIRIRRKGAGRQSLVSAKPDLPAMLEELIEPSIRGDPESPLRWTCKSTRVLAKELTRQGCRISHEKVAQLLRSTGYSLQGNRKTEEGSDHPDRDKQFRYINKKVRKAMACVNPVVSVDTKKKELIGNFDNKGRQWRKAKNALRVNGHDFPKPSIPRAYPYGIYDLGLNRGFVNVGTDHDTAVFAVASLRGWWRHEGRTLYSKVTELLITADSGGSNGYRLRLWKRELQKMADEIDIPISVCHFPPGTSKWNKVEHRLFSFISSNWRSEPLRDYETVVRLIAGTTTAKGLAVVCRLDRRKYPIGCKVNDVEMAKINLVPDKFHGEWNYRIQPSKNT